MKTLGSRLRKTRKLRELSQGALAKQIGTSPNQISMIENGQSGTSIRTIVAAESALNVSLDFLAGLSAEPRSAHDLLYDLKAAHARAMDLERKDPPPSEYYTPIEVSDNETAAGRGVTADGEGVKSMIQFPSNWLRKHGLNASECRVISGKGESMEPTLADGCSILIRLTGGRRDGRIYVIRIDDELIAKRTGRNTEAGWMLVSDNPDQDRFATTAVAGRRQGHRRSEVVRSVVRVERRRGRRDALLRSSWDGSEPAGDTGTLRPRTRRASRG